MLSKEIQEVIAMLKKSKAAGKGVVMTPERALADRNRIDDVFRDMPVSECIEVKAIQTPILQGEFYTYDPKAPDKLKDHVILFIHGGGFMNGSVLSRRKLCNNLMEKTKMDAFSVEYGQWPEKKHPQGLEDCVAAYDWLLEQGYDHECIYVFGESAGAMLTLTMTLYLKEKGRELPGKAVVFSPVAGQEIDLPSHKERDASDPMISYEPVVPYYEDSNFLSPLVSPIYGDFTGFPPLYIHVGTEEVLYDDAHALYEKCKAVGVDVKLKVWDDLFHVFPLFECHETTLALEDIAAFYNA